MYAQVRTDFYFKSSLGLKGKIEDSEMDAAMIVVSKIYREKIFKIRSPLNAVL